LPEGNGESGKRKAESGTGKSERGSRNGEVGSRNGERGSRNGEVGTGSGRARNGEVGAGLKKAGKCRSFRDCLITGSSAESVGKTDLLRHPELTVRNESLRAGRVRVSE
jgi:hypothetical protein